MFPQTYPCQLFLQLVPLFQWVWSWNTGDPVMYQAVLVHSIDYTIQECMEDLYNITHKLNLPLKYSKTFFNTFGERDNSNKMNISSLCMAMLLHNLAQLEWTSVNCNREVIGDIFCEVHNKRTKRNISRKLYPFSCMKGEVLRSKSCFSTTWTDNAVCQKKISTDSILFLLHPISARFPPFYSCQHQTVYIFQKFFTVYNITFTVRHKTALHLQDTQAVNFGELQNTFNCAQNIMVSLAFLCDGFKDCHENDTDEINKICKIMSTSSYSETPQLCASQFYRTNKNRCVMYTLLQETQENDKEQTMSHFSTNNNEIDEGNAIGKSESWPECSAQGLLFCKSSQICFRITQICIFTLNETGQLVPCPKGDHMANCSQYECNAMFKCPQYYCIPWRYICNGKWDCPAGTDELLNQTCGEISLCVGLFKCRKSVVCIHLRNICDGCFDCPEKDDEILCKLAGNVCIQNCTCLLFAISCVGHSVSGQMISRNVFPHVSILFDKCVLPLELEQEGVGFFDALVLVIRDSGLTRCCSILDSMAHVVFVNLNSNNISILGKTHSSNKQNMSKLIFLDVSNNFISDVQTLHLLHLPALLLLNLSSNCLTAISPETLPKSSHLRCISLRNNQLDEIAQDTFSDFVLDVLQTDDYRLCCLMPEHTKCTGIIPWHKSCESILHNSGVKITFYIICSFLVLLNTVSLALQIACIHMKVDRTAAFAAIIVVLNTADLLGSVPLFILWISDLIYNVDFVLHESDWLSSAMCHAISGTGLFYNFVYPPLLILLSLSRLMVILHPMDSKMKETDFVLTATVAVFVPCLFVSIILSIITWAMFPGHKLTIFLCSNLIDPTKEILLPVILVWFTCLYQLSIAIVISLSHVKLILELQESQNRVQNSISKGRSSFQTVLQVVIISVSNILCWVGCGVIYISSLYMNNYPTEMLVWVSIVVAPINSMINPAIFIVTTIRKIKNCTAKKASVSKGF